MFKFSTCNCKQCSILWRRIEVTAPLRGLRHLEHLRLRPDPFLPRPPVYHLHHHPPHPIFTIYHHPLVQVALPLSYDQGRPTSTSPLLVLVSQLQRLPRLLEVSRRRLLRLQGFLLLPLLRRLPPPLLRPPLLPCHPRHRLPQLHLLLPFPLLPQWHRPLPCSCRGSRTLRRRRLTAIAPPPRSHHPSRNLLLPHPSSSPPTRTQNPHQKFHFRRLLHLQIRHLHQRRHLRLLHPKRFPVRLPRPPPRKCPCVHYP
mmetsp:Transcript_3301/g.7773  ORF Transcript_3301/g.7773 Transcript_3301/m.7773 type:complete len:256 (+) Transcript_3301:83-850(+)